MRLQHLSLQGFRNLRDAELSFPPEGVAIVGRNAQGKTNLLEAVAYLETFRSFRGAADERLVRFGEGLFRLAGAFEEASGGTSTSVAAAFQVRPRTKRVKVDEVVPDRLGDAIGRAGTVLFRPADLRLVSEGPDERRRFLDVLLSLNEPGYLAALQRYRQALGQRNAALRAGKGPAEAWEGALLRWGGVVAWARASWIREMREPFAEGYREVFGGATAHLRYEPSVSGGEEAAGADEVAERFAEALHGVREQERRRGMTLVGPHRDELRMLLEADGHEAVDVREFGSGGQRRTAALALRLVEAETLRRRRRREPILLLDDVFAELDEERSLRLLDLLDRLVPGQVILTAPKESDVRFRSQQLSRWSIREGEVTT